MQFKSAPERFDMASDCLEDVRVLAEKMQEIGCYGSQEETAFKSVVLSLVKAMAILDPEASSRLAAERMKEYAAAMNEEAAKPSETLGLYL